MPARVAYVVTGPSTNSIGDEADVEVGQPATAAAAAAEDTNTTANPNSARSSDSKSSDATVSTAASSVDATTVRSPPLKGSKMDSRDGLTVADVQTGFLTPKPGKQDSFSYQAPRLLVGLLVGMVFGMCIHKSSVFRADVLRQQFDFSNNIMLQIFLAATATSTLVLTFMHHHASTSAATKPTQTGYIEACRGVPSTIVGAALLGGGMALAGACPGTIWVQIGSGAYQGLITLGGAAVGSIAYCIAMQYGMAPFIKVGILPADKRSLYSMFKLPRTLVGVALFVCMMAIAVTLSVLLNPISFFPSAFTAIMWSPVFCGILLGMLQIPLVLALAKNLGSSSAVLTLVGNALFFVDLPEMAKLRHGLANWWQVMYMFGAAAGAALVTYASDDGWYNTSYDVSPAAAFIGGFIAFFGSRIAGGCTSGHGISGAGHLGTNSYIAICAMFAGGIAVQNIRTAIA